MPDDTHQYDDDAVAALEALAPVPLSADMALAQEALSQALSRKTMALLKQPSQVLILKVPNRDWVGPIGEALAQAGVKDCRQDGRRAAARQQERSAGWCQHPAAPAGGAQHCLCLAGP